MEPSSFCLPASASSTASSRGWHPAGRCQAAGGRNRCDARGACRHARRRNPGTRPPVNWKPAAIPGCFRPGGCDGAGALWRLPRMLNELVGWTSPRSTASSLRWSSACSLHRRALGARGARVQPTHPPAGSTGVRSSWPPSSSRRSSWARWFAMRRCQPLSCGSIPSGLRRDCPGDLASALDRRRTPARRRAGRFLVARPRPRSQLVLGVEAWMERFGQYAARTGEAHHHRTGGGSHGARLYRVASSQPRC